MSVISTVTMQTSPYNLCTYFFFSLITSNPDIGSLEFRPPCQAEGREVTGFLLPLGKRKYQYLFLEDSQLFKSLGRSDMKTEMIDGNEF